MKKYEKQWNTSEKALRDENLMIIYSEITIIMRISSEINENPWISMKIQDFQTEPGGGGSRFVYYGQPRSSVVSSGQKSKMSITTSGVIIIPNVDTK